METKKDVFLVQVDETNRISSLTDILAGLVESRDPAARQAIEQKLSESGIPGLKTLAASILLAGNHRLSTLAGQSLGAHVHLHPDFIEVDPFPHEKDKVVKALLAHEVPGWMGVRVCDVSASEKDRHPHTNITSEGTEIARMIENAKRRREQGATLAG